MTEAPWIAAAKTLKPGGRLRMLCQCAPHRSPSLMVEHSENGALRAWCFRCKDPGFYVPPPHESLAEQRARCAGLRARDGEFKDRPTLPLPINSDVPTWPLEARVWLYKAGLSAADIQAHGIYYHEPTQRVVLPVVHEGQVIYWQARGFAEFAPKYINPRVNREHIVYEEGPEVSPMHNVVVLTEDILSAIRVGRAVPAWALLGTDMKDAILARLIREGLGVFVWMDPDDPGQDAARKIVARLNLFGVPHANIVSEHDPKKYTPSQVLTYLESATVIYP